jgi:hypothetical protein
VVTTGRGLTVTCCEALAVQPLLAVPTTEYVVVVPGDTVIEAVDALVLHTYVLAPEAVNVVDAVLQMVEVPEMETIT